MSVKENMPKLFEFIGTQIAVRDALFHGKPVNTGCVTANAYDFRMSKTPPDIELMRALRYLGFVNRFKIDTGIFVRNALGVVEYERRKADPASSVILSPQMKKYIVGFRNYDRLKKGRIVKWRRLPGSDL